MSVNQTNLRGVHLTLPVPIAANAGVGPISGDPLVFGRGTSPSFGLAGVAETSYTPPTGVATGSISVNFEGIYNLSVIANNGTISPGDRVYAIGGTYDVTTGCLYGFTLSNTSTAGEYFGNVMTTILSGVTAIALVRLKVSG